MTQYVINIGTLPNDGTGDPLRTAFNEVNLNFDQVFAAGPVLSNVQIANNTILTTNTNGNLVLAPNGVGVVQANVNIVPNTSNIRNLGSADQRWSTLYIQYANISGAITVSDLTATGNVTVGGNLSVTGNVINVGNIITDAKTIQLANTAGTANQADGSGITVGANDAIATMLYSSADNVWAMNIGLNTPDIVVNNISSDDSTFVTVEDGLDVQGDVTAEWLYGTGLTVSSAGNIWTIANNTITGPAGGQWTSDTTTKDTNFVTAPDGYLTLSSLYANSNVASQLIFEHAQARLFVNDGDNYEWKFDDTGNTTVPGNIVPENSNVYSLGNVTNLWKDLYIGNISANNIVGSSLNVNDGVNFWSINGQTLSAPGGAVIDSSDSTKDLNVTTAADGYLTLSSLYANANVATQWVLEHTQARLFVNDGDDKEWIYDLDGVSTFPGNIVPNTSNVYSLGNATNQWKSLYVSNNTIYINNVPVGLTAGNVLTVNGNAVLQNDSNTTISTTGNITADYFFGNGSQLTGIETSQIFNGNSNVEIATADGNVTVTANGSATWTFADSGITTFPTGLLFDVFGQIYNTIGTMTLGSSDYDVQILANVNSGSPQTWQFGTDGNLTNPGAISAVGNITGNYFIGNGSQLTGLPASYSNANVATFLAAYGSNTISTTGNITAGNLISSNTIFGNPDLILGNTANASATLTRIVTDTTFSYIQTGNGTVGSTGNIVFSPYSSSTQRVVIDTASGDITATGNVTADNFIGNISLTGNVTGTSSNVELVAGVYDWTFDNTGNLTLPGNTFAVNYANGIAVDPVTRFAGSWSVANGTANYSFTVNGGHTYTMWVNGNIPNGIIVWNATATLTNTNVPAIGTQYAWYYPTGNALVLNSIPSQIIGTAGAISNTEPVVANTNVFTFSITNNSGSTQTVDYGWIQVS